MRTRIPEGALSAEKTPITPPAATRLVPINQENHIPDSMPDSNKTTTKRTKSPASYDVFRAEGDTLTLVKADVTARSRREAIATAAPTEYGTFAVVRSGELKVLTRTKKVVETEDWS